jgi:thioredoxin-related protein
MKIYILFIITLLSITNMVNAKKKKKSKAKVTNTSIKVLEINKDKTNSKVVNNKEINWLTWEEAQKQMAIKPKKVYVDVFTDWCGWCKVMDKKTFSNPNVIQYMNENFYAIKFNSEKDDNITFQGKLYKISNGTSELAIELMKGSLSYPTSIFFEEKFVNSQPVPGYLDIKNIQPILSYLGGNHQKTTPWPDYQKAFIITWE